MHPTQFFNLHKSQSTGFHNLCTTTDPPPGTDQLLRNGLTFCIEKPLPKPHLDRTFERLTEDIRRKVFWHKRGGDFDDEDFEKKLWIKSGFQAEEATPEIEEAILAFSDKITATYRHNLAKQRRKHNIPPVPRKLLTTLPNNKDFIVLATDKNLGPAILQRDVYKQRCLDDHLLDAKTYRRLTQAQAKSRITGAIYQLKLLVNSNRKKLSKTEINFFDRCLKRLHLSRIPQFYALPKVHKKPWATRPIVSGVDSAMSYPSIWADVKLQSVVHLCPGYLKDSKSLLRKLKSLGPLPPNAVVVTADAVSMYTNIDITHSVEVLQRWFALHAHQLPTGFPVQMVLQVIKLVMTNNVFQFDDTFWLQLTGTAMGTSVACMLATIYYSYHEETRILPVFAHKNVVHTMLMPPLQHPAPTFANPPLLLHARLIDDAIQIWDLDRLPLDIQLNLSSSMNKELQFGLLEWDVTEPSKSADFLDLTIGIEKDGSIVTKTYVKPMNLHLYIPPDSAHPAGVLKSLVFGNLQRYRIQNTYRADFISAGAAFYGHLLKRGWSRDALDPIFRQAAVAMDKKFNKQLTAEEPLWDATPKSSTHSLFIHWEYHPRDIGRQTIRQIFNETLAPVLSESGLNVRRLTIAYSTPRSLGSCLTKTQLEEPDDIRVSSYIESMEPPANL